MLDGGAGEPGGLPGRGVCVSAVVAQYRQPGVQQERGGGAVWLVGRGHGCVRCAAGGQGSADQPARKEDVAHAVEKFISFLSVG